MSNFLPILKRKKSGSRISGRSSLDYSLFQLSRTSFGLIHSPKFAKYKEYYQVNSDDTDDFEARYFGAFNNTYEFMRTYLEHRSVHYSIHKYVAIYPLLKDLEETVYDFVKYGNGFLVFRK